MKPWLCIFTALVFVGCSVLIKKDKDGVDVEIKRGSLSTSFEPNLSQQDKETLWAYKTVKNF